MEQVLSRIEEKTAPRQITMATMKKVAAEEGIDVRGAKKKQALWNRLRAFFLEKAERGTNLMALTSEEVRAAMILSPDDCSAWLPQILEREAIGGGIEGAIYPFAKKEVLKTELGTPDALWSILFMKKTNQFLDRKIPHFARIFMVYRCQIPGSLNATSYSLNTIMERIDGPELETIQKRLTENEKQSMVVQVLMVLVLFFYHGMNHFDLHTKNILLDRTDANVLEYHLSTLTLRIPTYGRLVKILDYGDVGFLGKEGIPHLSQPKSIPGLTDPRKSPHTFYWAGLKKLCIDFPEIEEFRELCRLSKDVNDLLYDKYRGDLVAYRKQWAVSLFHSTNRIYGSARISGKKMNVKLV